MDIDITDLRSRDILRILQNYPQGHLEIKFERVFWCSDYTEPELPREEQVVKAFDPRRPPQARGLSGGFQRAADVLGSMVCAPGRR